MEALERIDKQPDSFEEVDRILKIVEQAKSEYVKINTEKSSRMLVALYLPMFLSVIGVLIAIYYLIMHEKNFINDLFFLGPLLIFLFIEIRYAKVYDKIIKEKRNAYESTNSQATELLREVIPIVSRRENWSALQMFELRLRLSKLEISPEGILDGKNL